VSSPSDGFECRWRPSRWLLAAYLLILALALLALLLADLPSGARLAGVLLCGLHAWWTVPRQLLLRSPTAVRGLRRDAAGWQLFSAAHGWQAVRLLPDSLALPGLIVLRYRHPGRWFSQGLCIPRDALPADQHRRLRVRLKFGRNRWAHPG
jgi:toxin CptA